MHLYIIRHADPVYGSDKALSDQGAAEARALGERMRRTGIDAVYSSDSRRAVKTAEALCESSGLVIKVEEWIREPAVLRIQQNGGDYAVWDSFGEMVRSGDEPYHLYDWYKREPYKSLGLEEAWKGFCRDCDAFTASMGYVREGLRYRIKEKNSKRIALVCHNGTVLLMLAHLLAIPAPLAWCGFYSWPSSVTDIYFESQSGDWAAPRALSVSDVSHLYKAGIDPRPRGMGEIYPPYIE